jgi:hypothetical protein
MPNFIDLTGMRFDRLVALGRAPADGRRIRWLCRCDCGNTATVSADVLRAGRQKSCGCWRREFERPNKTHGKRASRVYSVWNQMIQRCTNPNTKAYRYYGGRGITVCERWHTSFAAFLADMGEPTTKRHSIDRIDNNGHYEPGNCRWATRAEQMSNKRSNHVLEHDGKAMTVAEWSRETGIPASLIRDRLINRKWSVHDALTKPPRKIHVTRQYKKRLCS